MAIASDAAVERSSGRCPSFHSPGDTIRMGERIKALAELGEITEAAFRGGFETDAYGWALVRGLALSDGKVSDPVTAAKLLAGIDCGLAGVVPCGWNGETVAFAE